MSNHRDESAIKEIRERCKKQDPTMKIMFNPEQLIIGNYSPKLARNRPLIIEQNSNRKISMRLYIASDPLIGYEGRDMGISLTQLDNISVKDEEQENPAALTCVLKNTCIDRMWKTMTGLQQEVERSFKFNKAPSRNLTFILNSWPTEQDTFVKVTYGLGAEYREHKLDFEVGKMLLLKDIHAVWSQNISERWTQRARTTISHTQKLVTEMDSCAWVQWLANQKLRKTQNSSGFVSYVKSNDSTQTHSHKEEYPPKHHILKPFHGEGKNRKKKAVHKHIGELIRSAPRTRCRSVWLVATTEHSDAEPREEHYEPTYTREVHHRRVKRQRKSRTPEQDEQRSSNERDEAPKLEAVTLVETEVVVETKKFKFETIKLSEQAMQQQQPNGYGAALYHQPSTSYASVEYVEEQMRHLGEEVPNVEMAEMEGDANGVQNLPGDYQYYENHNNDMAPYWPPNGGALETNTLEEDDQAMMNYYFLPPNLQGPVQGDFQQVQQQEVQINAFEAQSGPKMVVPPRHEDRVSPDTQLFTFPPKNLAIPGIDPVVLLVKDVRTLDRKEFVNDNAMSFMLNYIAVYRIDKALMKTIHMCNTFFYVNLTRYLPALCFSQRKPIDPVHHNKLVENCSRMLRWTKKFDVFAKDYIVIPINEDYHWLLITVFNPAGAIVDLSDEEASRAAPKCYIAFFDPLSGLDPVKRNHMCHCIKTYLVELYAKTKNPGQSFATANPSVLDEERIVVMRPKNTAIQNNFYDCGLYTLHFIEGLFCYPSGPVSVNDFPDFDWSERYPLANEMADLMRDKIYNLVLQTVNKSSRSRLERFERQQRVGLSQEGKLRKARRHSATHRSRRHPDYFGRHYSVHPPSRNLLDDPMFSNPRDMAEMPITQRVRQLKWPEENFPVIY